MGFYGSSDCVGTLINSQWLFVRQMCIVQHQDHWLKVGMGMYAYTGRTFKIVEYAWNLYVWERFGLIQFKYPLNLENTDKRVDVVRLPSTCDKSIPKNIDWTTTDGIIDPPRDGNCGGKLGRTGLIIAGGAGVSSSAKRTDTFRVSEIDMNVYSQCNNIKPGIIPNSSSFCASASYPNSLCQCKFN